MHITRKQHLMLAFTLWFLTGTVFFTVSLYWFLYKSTLEGSYKTLPVSTIIIVYLASLTFGILKAKFAMGKAGKRAINRIQKLPEKSLFIKTFSPPAWIFVGCMMAMGAYIRYANVDIAIKMTIYVIIGTALLIGCTVFIQAIKNAHGGETSIEYNS